MQIDPGTCSGCITRQSYNDPTPERGQHAGVMVDSSGQTPLTASRLRRALGQIDPLPELLPGIYAEDLIHLLRKRRAFEGSRSLARKSIPELASKLDHLHGILILRLALGRVRVDMIPAQAERRNINPRLLDPLPDRFDRGVIQGIEAQFPSEALGLH
jgi:hypothetical protein